MTWTEKDAEVNENIIEKQDDLAIIVQYTQKVFSNHLIKIDIKIFDGQQIKFNNYYQKYGHIPDTDIEVIIIDEDNQEFYSINGTTNDQGLYEVEYLLPSNSKDQALTVTINAENENSKSSKILQVFSLGNQPISD